MNHEWVSIGLSLFSVPVSRYQRASGLGYQWDEGRSLGYWSLPCSSRTSRLVTGSITLTSTGEAVALPVLPATVMSVRRAASPLPAGPLTTRIIPSFTAASAAEGRPRSTRSGPSDGRVAG